MIEDTTEYEYKIADTAPMIVLVRAKKLHYGPGAGWRVYHFGDSPDDAQRILALLLSDQTVEGVVLP